MILFQDDFVRYAAKRNGWSISTTKVIVRELFDTLEEVLLSGNGVRFYDFGTFNVVDCKERAIGALHTHEKVMIPPSRYLKFSVGRGLRERIRESKDTKPLEIPQELQPEVVFDDSGEID